MLWNAHKRAHSGTAKIAEQRHELGQTGLNERKATKAMLCQRLKETGQWGQGFQHLKKAVLLKKLQVSQS